MLRWVPHTPFKPWYPRPAKDPNYSNLITNTMMGPMVSTKRPSAIVSPSLDGPCARSTLTSFVMTQDFLPST